LDSPSPSLHSLLLSLLSIDTLPARVPELAAVSRDRRLLQELGLA
jgi:hypothetical protein